MEHRLCMRCKENKHYVSKTGSFLCDTCFEKQVKEIKEKCRPVESSKNWTRVAIENGINLHTYKTRLRNGWDEGTAATFITE
ncbi:MAG TPA: hypothetical protein VIG73_08200 [Cerasibacillus sp.]|uniref:hypothetical protein n=1 Tax=Cerasibacillus sp. TaxID=2498711 RepID=UPI002F40980F